MGEEQAVSKGWSVVGVDGCREGWVVARWTADQDGNETVSTTIEVDLGTLVDEVRAGDIDVAAIDMPMGLFDDGPRFADGAARKLLSPRGSTIFSAPARCTLASTDYQHACELSRNAIGKALSIQAFNLLPKIRELDNLIDGSDQDKIVESHPECSFSSLANGPLLESKHGADGKAIRLELLITALGPLFEQHWNTDRPKQTSSIDIVDAWSLAVAARRISTGTSLRLSDDRIDPTGKIAQIVF